MENQIETKNPAQRKYLQEKIENSAHIKVSEKVSLNGFIINETAHVYMKILWVWNDKYIYNVIKVIIIGTSLPTYWFEHLK